MQQRCWGDEQPVFGWTPKAEGEVESYRGDKEGEVGCSCEYNSSSEQVEGEEGEGMMWFS